MDRFDFSVQDIRTTGEYSAVVNYALARNDLPIVRDLRIENTGDDPVEDVDISVEPSNCDHETTNDLRWSTRIARLDPGDIWNIHDVDLQFPKDELVHLDERTNSELDVRLKIGDDTSQPHTIEISRLPYNYWPGVGTFPLSLTAFVLPNHPRIPQVVTRMRDLMERWTGQGSLEGYQATDRGRIRKMVAACHIALKELGFSYVNPPASFERNGQKVRTPDQMLNTRMGTCLDLTLLAAAALEHIGLRPILAILRGHAFVGCWLEERTFADPLIDDGAELRKRTNLGQTIFFDPTEGVSGGASFDEAEATAQNHLEDLGNFVIGIDVHAARLDGVLPIASKVIGEDGQLQVLDHSDRESRSDEKAPKAGANLEELEARAAAHLQEEDNSEQDSGEEVERLSRWRSKLLDLSLRNRLLNFKHTQKTSALMFHDVGRLEDEFAAGTSLQLEPKPSQLGAFEALTPEHRQLYDSDQLRTKLSDSLSNGRLHSAYPPAAHEKRLKKIHRRARRERQETGVNLLHVALGFLRWFDPNTPNRPRTAPLILLPAELSRKSARSQYELELTDDEAFINQSLLQKLDKEFGIEVEGLSTLPEDASGLDVQVIFRQFREAILDMDGWDVFEDACLGIFSFGSFLMWHDLKENERRLQQNDVVRGILDPNESIDQAGQTDSEESEDFCVMEADSSQLSAVRAASGGESFVLEGPPGTGKSQTITNIIGQCLAEGKNVLFVAEKQAALQVVYRRLEEVELDDFCLRLHSENANKRAVASQLGESIRVAETHPTTKWDEIAGRLSDLRDPINEYVRAIHEEREAGLSLFQAVSRLTELRDYPEVRVDLGNDPSRFDRNLRESWMDGAAQLARSAESIGSIADHPLRHIRAPKRSRSESAKAKDLIQSLSEVGQELKECAVQLEDDVPTPEDYRPESLKRHVQLLTRLEERPRGARLLINTPDWNFAAQHLREAIKAGRQLDANNQELANRYTEDVSTLDAASLRRSFRKWSDAFIVLSWLMLFMARLRVREVVKEGSTPSDEQVLSDLDLIVANSELENELQKAEVPDAVEGTLWQGSDTDWDDLESALDWVDAFRDLAGATSDPSRWLELAGTEYFPWKSSQSIADYTQAATAFIDTFETVQTELALNRHALDAEITSGSSNRETWLDGILDHARQWLQHTEEFRAWSHYLDARQTIEEIGGEALIAALESGELEIDEIEPSAERSILEWWTEQLISSEDALREFHGLKHEQRIDKFRELDAQSFEIARDEIRARVSSKIPDVQSASKGSEVGILLREIQKKSKHLPIRELFARTENLLPRIAPCMLMSPMSVAQYLSADPVDFDLVVFDEASQIPPWNALGALSRADQCVVVGDSNQLPPTSFFSKTYDGEELQEIEDLESILDECVAAGLHKRRLGWHYRSRDESLIAFSNYHYYDNDLYTFPNARSAASSLGIEHRFVEDGYYDRGGSRTNEREAAEIVDEIVRRLSDEEESERSIGVVTFSQAQQQLIEDMLEEERRESPEIEPFFSDSIQEPVFVKNLENVQGDERDIMMFSICYAPDEEGHMTMNFGPLNRKGGERRLNVAITRAREELLLFTSLEPEQIDLTRTSATAVEHLKQFLRFAKLGPRALAEVGGSASGRSRQNRNAIRNSIATHLRNDGWKVDTGIGSSGYEIDVAVEDPNQPESYILGIEIDGENYRLGETARDRERTRPLVLQGLGWRHHRVWSVEWWHNPGKELEKIEDKLSMAQDQPPPSRASGANKAVEVDSADSAEKKTGQESQSDKGVENEQKEWVDSILDADFDWTTAEHAIPLKQATPSGEPRTQEEFDNDSNLAQIASHVREIAQAEAPVSFESVARRVARHWGYARLSSRIKDRIRMSLKRLGRTETVQVIDGWIWGPEHLPEEYLSFRPATDGRPREAEDIPPQEAANAALEVLRRNVAIEQEELHRQIADAFGFSRIGGNLRQLGEDAVEVLLQTDRATRGDDVIRISEDDKSQDKSAKASDTSREQFPDAPNAAANSIEHATEDTQPLDLDVMKELPGVGKSTRQSLLDAGFVTIGRLSSAEPSELTETDGIGTATADKIKQMLTELNGDATNLYPFAEIFQIPASRSGSENGRTHFRLESGEEGSPEELAAMHFQADGWESAWAGNSLWTAMAAFLFWDEIFAEIDGAYHPEIPFPSNQQDMPSDLFQDGFWHRRRSIFERRLESLTGVDLGDELRRSLQEHWGKPCRLIDYDRVDAEVLHAVVQRLRPNCVLAVASRILKDVSKRRSGLPELVLLNGSRVRLLEAKHIDESMPDNKRDWLEFFAGQGERPLVSIVGSL